MLWEVGAKDPDTYAKLLDEHLDITTVNQLRKLRQKTLEAAIADGSIKRKYDTVIQCAIERAAEVAVEESASRQRGDQWL